MLTRTAIRGYTNTTSYNKGLDLYRMDKVLEFSVEEDDKRHIIQAVVIGSGSFTA